MELLYFMLRYIPFWSIPLGMITGEFGYIYWLKSFQRLAYVLFGVTLFCILLNVFYFWAGGPDKIVPYFHQLLSS